MRYFREFRQRRADPVAALEAEGVFLRKQCGAGRLRLLRLRSALRIGLIGYVAF